MCNFSCRQKRETENVIKVFHVAPPTQLYNVTAPLVFVLKSTTPIRMDACSQIWSQSSSLTSWTMLVKTVITIFVLQQQKIQSKSANPVVCPFRIWPMDQWSAKMSPWKAEINSVLKSSSSFRKGIQSSLYTCVTFWLWGLFILLFFYFLLHLSKYQIT